MAVKRKYRLNLRNYGNLPAIMLSQYDEGYALEFEIRDGTDAASDLSAYTVTLKGTRADTLAYSFSGTIATNVLTFVIDTTMTACAGRGTAEIAIKDTANDVLFATFNMPVFVERAAVPEGSIDADVERAQEIAEQVQEIVDNAAAAVSGEAEKWATGQINGTDVPSTDPAYENNAKYYAEQAETAAASIGIDATLTQSGKAADAKKTGDEITALKETAYNNIMLDEVTEEGEIETTTEYNQDSEIFTMVGGYPNKYGVLTSADNEQNKTYYFQASEDCKVYAQFNKTYYLCVYNTEPFKSANLVVRTGSTAPNPPTVDTPLSVTAGQFISFSIFNDYPKPFTLYVITTETGEVTTLTVIGVQKARITALETDMETAQDNIAEIMNGLPVEYAIDHVLCIGDSLTFGSPADQSTMPYPISQNYPYYLGRMLGLTGNVTNGGVPNYGAKTYYHSKFGDYTLTDYNTFIIFLGTNSGLTDTLDTDVNPYTDYTDFADTDTGCYCKMIESIYEANPNAIIILVNTWHVASVQPVTRTTIDKIGVKYGLPVVETYDVMRYGVNPNYHGNVDNVHCSKAGYLALANLIKNKIYEYMSTDLNNVNKGMS